MVHRSIVGPLKVDRATATFAIRNRLCCSALRPAILCKGSPIQSSFGCVDAGAWNPTRQRRRSCFGQKNARSFRLRHAAAMAKMRGFVIVITANPKWRAGWRLRSKAGFRIYATVMLLLACGSPPAFAKDPAPLPWTSSPTTRVMSEPVTFRNGDTTLSGTLYLPGDRHLLGAVIVTHTASKPLGDASLYHHLVQMLPPLGIAVLTYDRRGSGRSGGTLESSDYAILADDAIAAARLLKADPRIDPARIGVWGLSQGGWLALLAAAKSPDIRFVVSIAAPVVTPDVQMMYRSENALRIRGYSEADITQMRATRQAIDNYMRGVGDRDTAQRLTDAARTKPWFELLYLGPTVGDRATSRWRKEMEYDPLPTLEKVEVPALILFGANDPVVPVATSVARISGLHRPNIVTHVVADADHHMATSMTPETQMNPSQTAAVAPEAVEYFSVMTSWMSRQDIARSTDFRDRDESGSRSRQ